MFENNIRYAREELEMTQKELGYIFGVSDSAVRLWETAHDSIPFNKLIKFCNMFDYSLDFVCGLTRRNIKYGKFKTDKTKISKKLKKLRTELKITQQVLTDECKISQTTYSGYETGHYLISTTNLYYICKTYNISMDWIVGRTNNMYINSSKKKKNRNT